jgi:hypothetical protein
MRLLALALLIVRCAAVTPTPAPTDAQSPSPSVAPRTSDLGAYFDRPPDFPGYPWTYQGQPVDTTHGMNTIAAAGHCGWQAATLLHLPWPLGMNPTSGADVRRFVRDPKLVTPQSHLRGTLDLYATLPVDATATGYRYHTIEVYISPSNQDVVYFVGPAAVERWPRAEPKTLCA